MSVRALMAVVLLVGGCVGWLTYRAQTQRAVVAAIVAAGGKARYRWQVERGWRANPPGRAWLEKVVGPDFLGNVIEVDGGGEPSFDIQFEGKVDDALLAQIGRLGRLEVLSLRNCPSITDDGLAHLRGLGQLRSLKLAQTKLTGRSLVHLAGLSRLETLDLGEIPLSDADLVHLSRLSSLKDLVLNGERLTDAGLAHLSGLARLERLMIFGPTTPVLNPFEHMNLRKRSAMTTAGLANLRGLTRLKFLSLDSSRIDNLAPIAPLEALEELDLSTSSIDDEGLRAVAGLRELRSLDLDDSSVGDAGLAYLAGLPILETLRLGETRVTNAGLVHLARLPKLKDLNLRRTAITDPGMKPLGKLVGLNRLDLSYTRITDAGLVDLAPLRAYVSVFMTPVTSGGIAAMAKLAPGLHVSFQ